MKRILFSAIALSKLVQAEEQCPTIECCQLVYPSCRFETHCGWGTFLTAEGLYWVAKENGLILAQKGVPAPGPQTDAIPPLSFNFRGDLLRIDPDFDWGFRIGLGYNFCFDEWDAKASWTSYQTQKGASYAADDNLLALNLWGHSDVTNSSASSIVNGDWDFCYNTLDLQMGRAFGAGQCFCLYPYFGIRAAWIDQTLTSFNQVALLNRPGESLSTNLRALSDFSGAGLRFGLDGRFDFCYDISLYGVASYSVLYGKFDTSFTETVSGDNPSSGLDPVTNLVIADACDVFHMGTSALQLALGIQWNRGFCCDRYRFGLNIGWEQNLWFQLNQMNHFQSAFNEGHLLQENGNLSLQGISFGARLDF